MAYDILHDVIERLLRSKSSKDINDSYMFNALRNRSIDIWRKESKQNNEPIESAPLVELSAPTFEDIMVDKSEIASLMAKLNGEEQSLLYLHVVEGYTVQEISEHLESPKGTILSKIHRIKAKLKNIANRDITKKEGS